VSTHIPGQQTVSCADAERVLRSLPEWFGLEAALIDYALDASRLPTFSVRKDQALAGFLSLRQHFPQAWEISCVAVHANHRGGGIGKGLLQTAEAWCGLQGARILQVKTLADAHPSPAYQQTRAFYQHMGYIPLEVFPDLWSPQHPCLQMIKVLAPASAP